MLTRSTPYFFHSGLSSLPPWFLHSTQGCEFSFSILIFYSSDVTCNMDFSKTWSRAWKPCKLISVSQCQCVIMLHVYWQCDIFTSMFTRWIRVKWFRSVTCVSCDAEQAIHYFVYKRMYSFDLRVHLYHHAEWVSSIGPVLASISPLLAQHRLVNSEYPMDATA